MNNGSSSAVLVWDLFRGDGPFVDIADDFVVQRCSVCHLEVSRDAQFTRRGYWCPACLGAVVETSEKESAGSSSRR
jgi:hypothetical protein